MDEGNIKRVTIEYENVTYVAEGEDAKEWKNFADSTGVLAFIHGAKGFNQWTRVEEKK